MTLRTRFTQETCLGTIPENYSLFQQKIMNNLQYPLNIVKILRKKKSIKKDLLLNDNLIEKNIAILGGSTTAEIKNILELFLLKHGIKPNFYESEYNKYYEDALFGNNEVCMIHRIWLSSQMNDD